VQAVLGDHGHNVFQYGTAEPFLRKDLPDFLTLLFRDVLNVLGFDPPGLLQFVASLRGLLDLYSGIFASGSRAKPWVSMLAGVSLHTSSTGGCTSRGFPWEM
jgi:hypothetical protein